VASRRPPVPPARPLASAAIPQNHLQHAARELMHMFVYLLYVTLDTPVRGGK
jgi:hypothetical protein